MELVIEDRQGVKVVGGHSGEHALVAFEVPFYVIVAGRCIQAHGVALECIAWRPVLSEPVTAFKVPAQKLEAVLVAGISSEPWEVIVGSDRPVRSYRIFGAYVQGRHEKVGPEGRYDRLTLPPLVTFSGRAAVRGGSIARGRLLVRGGSIVRA